MKYKKNKFYFFYFILLFLTGCITNRINVVEGCKYDKNTNRTNYFVMPFGNVSIQGEWIKTKQSDVSYQQFFTNKENTAEIAVALGRIKNYEFNVDGLLTDFNFVKAFYEWDSKYLAKNALNREVIEQDSVNNFIIWRLFDTTGNTNVDTYFLIGTKNKSVYNLAVYSAEKWATIDKIKFLRTLFLNKE